MSDSALIPVSSPPVAPAAPSEPRDYNKGNWTVTETLTLIAAKRLDDERRSRGERPPGGSGSGASGRPSEQRWKWVENYCWRNGCQRSQNQCNDKWDNLLRDYKKVVSYESRGGGTSAAVERRSYWALERHERKDRNLPTNLASEVFEALTDVLGRRSARRGTVVAPIALMPPAGDVKQQREEEAAAQPVRPTVVVEEQQAGPASVSVENLSDSSEDTDVDEYEASTKRRRKMRRLGASVVRGASVLAQALLSCEERRERRHRERMELEERRLRLEAERTELSRQGFTGIIAAVGGLSGALHTVAGDGRRRNDGGSGGGDCK